MNNKINNKIKKYSIKNLSIKTGISEPTIYRYMKNESLEGHIKFLKLLKLLDISVEDFLKDNNL